jgi:uncharacterized protein
MVVKAELVAASKRKRIPLGIIEKDYVLTFILKKIYESKLNDILIFKGGTALHKLYLHERFSLDIDFTALEGFDIDDLKRIVENKEINSKIKDVIDAENSTKIVLGYRSVLEYNNKIFIDVSRREKPVLPLKKMKIKSDFFGSFEVLTFQLEEIAAEKIRALMQRNKPRDYLDMCYLIDSGIDFTKTFDVAKKKLADSNDSFDIKRIFDNIELVRSLWEQDLREILPTIPEFGKIEKKLRVFFMLK